MDGDQLLTFENCNKSCMDLQEAVSGGDADDSSMYETDLAHTPKADNSTDLSWSSSPVSTDFHSLWLNAHHIYRVI